jgi:hypothetical protein
VHELEIVHDDEVEAVLELKTPGLGPHLGNGETGRVIEVDRHLGQNAQGVRDQALVPVRVVAEG